MQRSGGRVYTGLQLLVPSDYAHVRNAEAGRGNLKALLGQNADVPFALASPQPGDDRTLEIAVIVFTRVPLKEPAFEPILIRTVASG
jgi:hypothetical protein